MKTAKDITVITLHGESGSGKDSTYLALKSSNTHLPRVSFGDMLREELYQVIGYTAKVPSSGLVSRVVGDERLEKLYPDPITGIVELATFKDLMVRWGRYQTLRDPFHYVRQITTQIHSTANVSGNNLVVITDCRRPHELAEIRANFNTYSFRVFHEGSRLMPLDRLLEGDDGITDLAKRSTPSGNARQIIDHMIRFLPPVFPQISI